MGAWSTDAFGNDTACDWAAELVEQNFLTPVERAIKRAMVPTPLDSDVAVEAVAAMEVLARLRGHPGADTAYTSQLDQWVRRTAFITSRELVEQSLVALDRILADDSELRQLWDESESARDWQVAMQQLRERLQAVPRPLRPPTPAESKDLAVSDAEAVLQVLSGIEFVFTKPASDVSATVLYQTVLAAGAMSDGATVREAIAYAWQPLVNARQHNILWDLAVREAQSWSRSEDMRAARQQLAWWCDSPEAVDKYDSRLPALHLLAGDLDDARAAYDALVSQSPDNLMHRLDRVLFEARLGSAIEARRMMDDIVAQLPAAMNMGKQLVLGIIACRLQEDAAMSHLTQAARELVVLSRSNAAGWSLLSYCVGWWALALQQQHHLQLARRAVDYVRPILVTPHHRDLLALLVKAGVLNATELPNTAPEDTPDSAAPALRASSAWIDHGSFRSCVVRGVNAMQWWQQARREYANGSRQYPFLIGSGRDLESLLDMLAPANESRDAQMELTRQFDVQAWLSEHVGKIPKSLPRKAIEPAQSPLILFDTLSGKLKSEMHVGLVEVAAPQELFVKLGYGDWNGCPESAVHTALHARWQQHYGAEPITVSGDVVECVVAQPVVEKAAALQLAAEQRAYCDDIVEQGVGTTGNLAVSLINSPYWYFWWD